MATIRAVRNITDRKLIGIFCSNSLEGLFDLIDEFMSPYGTEYASFPAFGGLLIQSNYPPVFPNAKSWMVPKTMLIGNWQELKGYRWKRFPDGMQHR